MCVCIFVHARTCARVRAHTHTHTHTHTQVMRDLCYSGQINCYVVDIGGEDNRHPDYLHDGLFLQTVSKGT